MNIKECYQYVTDRLNKLSSNNSQNIPFPQFVRAFNTSQLQWFEERMKIDQTNRIRIDELQQFVKIKPIKFSDLLPEDYFHILRVDGNYNSCSSNLALVKESDLNMRLNDAFWKPSKEWNEGLATISGDKINIYGDFITNLNLVYYRTPKEVDIEGYKTIEGVQSTNIDPELRNTSLIEVLDMTSKLLASDISDQFRYQTLTNKSNQYT